MNIWQAGPCMAALLQSLVYIAYVVPFRGVPEDRLPRFPIQLCHWLNQMLCATLQEMCFFEGS